MLFGEVPESLSFSGELFDFVLGFILYLLLVEFEVGKLELQRLQSLLLFLDIAFIPCDLIIKIFQLRIDFIVFFKFSGIFTFVSFLFRKNREQFF